MAWWIQPLQIANADGTASGRWRLTAQSDESGGGPYGDDTHDHPSAEEAQQCEACDAYCSRRAGLPSRKALAEAQESKDREDYERLRNKFEGSN